MALDKIFRGTVPKDNTGDSLWEAAPKINAAMDAIMALEDEVGLYIYVTYENPVATPTPTGTGTPTPTPTGTAEPTVITNIEPSTVTYNPDTNQFRLPATLTTFTFTDGTTDMVATLDGTWSFDLYVAYTPTEGAITAISDGVTHDGTHFLIPTGVTSFTFTEGTTDMQATFDVTWTIEEVPVNDMEVSYTPDGDIDLWTTYKTIGNFHDLGSTNTTDNTITLHNTDPEEGALVGRRLLIYHPTLGPTVYRIVSHGTGSSPTFTVDRNFEETASNQRWSLWLETITFDTVENKFMLPSAMVVFDFMDNGVQKMAVKNESTGVWSFNTISTYQQEWFEELNNGDDPATLVRWDTLIGSHIIRMMPQSQGYRGLQQNGSDTSVSVRNDLSLSTNYFVQAKIISYTSADDRYLGVASDAFDSSGLNAYVFEGRSSVFTGRIRKFVNGSASTVVSDSVIDSVPVNSYLRLHVIQEGDNKRLKAYIDGIKVADYLDESPLSGGHPGCINVESTYTGGNWLGEITFGSL